jgi:hypothetical protein
MSFAFINRRVNPLVGWVLRSPAHRLLSRHLALITVTGRRSGRSYTLPVAYVTTPEGVTVRVAAPEAKTWWRNLRSRASVELLMRGTPRRGSAQAVESDGRVTVAVTLDPPIDG